MILGTLFIFFSPPNKDKKRYRKTYYDDQYPQTDHPFILKGFFIRHGASLPFDDQSETFYQTLLNT
jgi:hypothetical protein